MAAEQPLGRSMIQVGNVKIVGVTFNENGSISVDASVFNHPVGFGAERESFDLPDTSGLPDISIMKIIRPALRHWASVSGRKHAEEFSRALRILDGA